MINNPMIETTKITEQTIVVTKSDFSNPRRVVYNSLELLNPEPSVAPRCCNKINKTAKNAETNIATSKKLPIVMLTPILFYFSILFLLSKEW